jgi:hypothetical protein
VSGNSAYFCAARADSMLAAGTNSAFASTKPLGFALAYIRPDLNILPRSSSVHHGLLAFVSGQ